jgi:hypothetical protein
MFVFSVQSGAARSILVVAALTLCVGSTDPWHRRSDVHRRQARQGRQYGEPVSLAKRASDDNLIFTTDFRRTYATVIGGWLGLKAGDGVLRGRFDPFPVFA